MIYSHLNYFKSLDKFNSNNFYETDELINEMKQKFNIEYVDLKSFDLTDSEDKISKGKLIFDDNIY